VTRRTSTTDEEFVSLIHPTRSAEECPSMLKLILIKDRCDPWHTTDETGFNKTGFVTERGIVFHPRRSRIAKTPIEAITRKPHRFIEIQNHSRAQQIETFFSENLINTRLYVQAIREIANANSSFWDNPVKAPILRAITPAEYEVRWSRMLGSLQSGDMIFTLDAKSFGSRLIAYLDQSTWSHVGTYTGNGRIVEAITSGVVERSIEAYHHPRFRLGVYRPKGASASQIETMIALVRSNAGARYSYRKALFLGIKLALGIWPPAGAKHTTPGMMIATGAYDLMEIV
jgi:hypothetical protein